MIFREAGECLSYALGNELIRGDEKINKHNYHLKAFITFFALKGYLTEDTIRKVQKLTKLEIKGIVQLKNQFRELSKVLVKDLKKNFEFSDFTELITKLNKISIPNWVFEAKGTLFELLPQVYQVRDVIYYLTEVKGKYYFRCIHICEIDNVMNFEYDFFEDFDTDMVSYEETNHTISTKYSKVLGFNECTMTFYMKYRHSNKMYAEYHVDTKQEIVHYNKCYGVAENRLPIIDKGENLSVAVGNNIKKIKKRDIREEYVVKSGYIYVYPTYRVPSMFRPYILLIDGERMDISSQEAFDYVMERIDNDIYDFTSLMYEDEETLDASVFTLEYLDKLLDRKYDLEENKDARRYHFIVKILKKYLPADEDVIDYFLLLSDASKRLEKEKDIKFIDDDLFWRLNELHLTNQLAAVIKNKEEFKKVLLQDAYWEEEITEDTYPLSISNEYVGYFDIKNGKIISFVEKIENAMCIGSMLLATWQDKPGIVAYNLDSGAYEIRYNRELNKNEVQGILEAYHIFDAAYCVSIDRKCDEATKEARI